MPNNRTTLSDYSLHNANYIYNSSDNERIDARIQNNDALYENMIPAIVKSYNPDTNEILVSIAIKAVSAERDENGEYLTYERGDVLTTAWLPCAGDMMIYFPYKEGDTGWLEASDRDTNSFKYSVENGNPEISIPQTFSLGGYKFGRFIPDCIKNGNIASSDNGSLVIQNKSGSTKIVVNPSGWIHIVAPSILTIDGDVNINGNLNVSKTITANQMLGGNISYTTHVHSNGAGQTTAPYNPQ